MSVTAERELLCQYFPQFTSPNVSRFELLFTKLKDNEINSRILDIYTIFPQKIIENKDRRTSIILKNIPHKIKKKKILKIVKSFGNINFFRCVLEYNSVCESNTFSVYINFVNYKSIVSLFMSLKNKIFTINEYKIPLEISYSFIQGRSLLINSLINYR